MVLIMNLALQAGPKVSVDSCSFGNHWTNLDKIWLLTSTSYYRTHIMSRSAHLSGLDLRMDMDLPLDQTRAWTCTTTKAPIDLWHFVSGLQVISVH